MSTAITPHEPVALRQLGLDLGRFCVPDDFDDPLPDSIADAFGRFASG
jgi:hypothetical protein